MKRYFEFRVCVRDGDRYSEKQKKEWLENLLHMWKTSDDVNLDKEIGRAHV